MFNSSGVLSTEVVTVDAVSGAVVSSSPLLFGNVMHDSIQYVDVNGDGKLRLAIGTTIGTYLTR
jgi:hypothetical protein